MSINRRMDKEVVVYTYIIGYYSTMKNNEIMPFAAIWMVLEIAILSEISQNRERYYMISLTWRI